MRKIKLLSKALRQLMSDRNWTVVELHQRVERFGNVSLIAMQSYVGGRQYPERDEVKGAIARVMGLSLGEFKEQFEKSEASAVASSIETSNEILRVMASAKLLSEALQELAKEHDWSIRQLYKEVGRYTKISYSSIHSYYSGENYPQQDRLKTALARLLNIPLAEFKHRFEGAPEPNTPKAPDAIEIINALVLAEDWAGVLEVYDEVTAIVGNWMEEAVKASVVNSD